MSIIKNNKDYGTKIKIIDTGEPVLQDITITSNGEYTAEQGYDGLGTVTASVAGANLTPMTANQNHHTYYPQGQWDGYSSVTVDVPDHQWPEYLRVWYLPENNNPIYPATSPSGFSRFRIQGDDIWQIYSNPTPIYPYMVHSPAKWRKFYIDFQLDDPTTIPDRAWNFDYNVVKIELPQSVTHIGDSAFYNCRNLQELPNLSNITYLGSENFYSVPIYIEGLIIDDNITRDWYPNNSWHSTDYTWVNGTLLDYQNGSFEDARSHKQQSNLDFTNGIDGKPIYKFYTYIGHNWPGYNSVRFPSMMTHMRGYQCGASTVGDIYFNNPVPPTVWNNEPPIHIATTITGHIYVPQGSLSAYQAAFPDFASYMAEMS